MTSSKTIRLLNILTEYADLGYKVLLINHSDDINRNVNEVSGSITTHSSQVDRLSDKITCIRIDKLCKCDVSSYDVIGIDEGQFYDDLYDAVVQMVNILNKIVICVSLDGDSSARPFGQVFRLIPIANKAKKLSAKCVQCMDEMIKSNFSGDLLGVPAPFTARKKGLSTDQKLVGGLDKYIPLCRKHYLLHNDSL